MEETKEKIITNEMSEKKAGVKIKDAVAIIKKSKMIIIIAVVAVVVVSVLLSVLFPKEKEIITTVESSLEKALETSEFSTVEYIYNSTVTVSDDENKPKYYVAYEGTVKAGFDFNDIKVERDDDKKKIFVVIPEIKINSVNISDKTLDFIFVKDRYDTETTYQEAYKISYDDLENKAKSNDTIKKMAYENAVDFMKAITKTLEAEMPEGYTFDFKKESESK